MTVQLIGGGMWSGARGQFLRKPNENVSGLVARLSLQSILLGFHSQQTSIHMLAQEHSSFLILSLVLRSLQSSMLAI